MKKSALFVFALISLFFCCQKNAAVRVDNNPDLNGTWLLKKEIVSQISNNTTTDTLSTFTKNDYYKFNVDNTVTYSSSSQTNASTSYYSIYTSNGTQILNIGAPNGPPAAFTSYTINKLTKDSLILYNQATSTVSGVTSSTYTTHFFTH